MDTDRTRRAIFAFCREHGIDSEARHAVQLRATGKPSLTRMDAREMHLVLQALKQTAGRARPSRHTKVPKRREVLPAGPHRSKLRALWICGVELGVIRNRDDDALATWICANAEVDAAVWATPAMTARCIEGLKDWLAREAGVDWSPYRLDGKVRHIPRARILEAQWRKLCAAGATVSGIDAALQDWVTGRRESPESYVTLKGREQDELIRALGRWLRETLEGDDGRDH